MSYRAIPRKYRPQSFSQVVGQEFITETLKNAIKSGRLSHAYIFAGPRGVGKTTTARIVAKAVNCENLIDGEPCNQCSQCTEIAKGSHPDVIEVDAASNRGIDQIRELRESVHYLPARGKKKVYIIDEFHMLTKEAFNALLKTLEEPPEHALFILATTEIDKIPPTILSRCQKFIFRRIPEELMVKTLSQICEKEKVEYEEEALRLIALSSEGCVRDAESLLEQAIALGNGRVETKKVSEFLGILTGREVRELLRLGFKGDKTELFKKLKKLEEEGYNPVFVVKQLLEVTEKEFMNPTELTEEESIAAYKILSQGYREISKHPYPYTALLFYLYKLSYFKEVKKLTELLEGGVKIEVPTQEGKQAEKKTKNETLEAFIEKRIDEGSFVRVLPVSKLAYKILKEREQELEESIGKPVKIEEPKESERRKEPSEESKRIISKLVKELEAKVLLVKVKDDESSNS